MFKKIIKSLVGIFPSKKIIVLESTPDLSDNTAAVFKEMISRGINKRYKFVWWVSDKNKPFPKIKNTVYLDRKGFWNNLLFKWYILRSKCLICCNKYLIPFAKKQKSFYLTHGTAIKSVRGYYNIPSSIDYTIVASEPSKKMMAYEFKYDEEKCIPLGFPRNDVLYNASLDLKRFFGNEYEKFIVWYPTFRQHKNGKTTGSINAMPIINSAEQAKKLNDIAKSNKTLLIVKPHFAQDISYINISELSNIIFINDAFFEDNQITSYEFVASCDSLITDYSSIYFDYLLCDKPVAVVWEDIDDYRKNPGFAIDVDYYLKAAHKIYNIDNFSEFIQDVACDKDDFKAARNEIKEWANCSDKPDNAARVVDFIIKSAKIY